MKKLAILAASSAFVLAACSGDETTNVTEVTESTGMDIIAKGEKMPACDKENAGKMVFVTDSSAVFYCANEKWATLNGKNGESGASADAKNGTSCTAKEVKDGIEVSCGGEVVGTIKNGTPGMAGDNCTVASDEGGVVTLSCGSGDDAKTTTVYKAMCGLTPYDPATHFCDERDGRAYRYVKIGKQTWMAENLNYRYVGVKYVYSPDKVSSDSTSWCYGDRALDNSSNTIWSAEQVAENCEKHGRLYTWSAAMDSVGFVSVRNKVLNEAGTVGCGFGTTCTPNIPHQGICPFGWHIPSEAEVNTLLSVTGKDIGFGGDNFGFSLLPTGNRGGGFLLELWDVCVFLDFVRNRNEGLLLTS